jgi:predicted ATPase/class 3 adenylate cyclase
MNELPSGTVTFLFTDIEGSTRALHELGGAAYARALGEHRRTLRKGFAARSGVEVDTQGDAFFYAFTRAADAVSAAQETQEALAAGVLRVRMGLHTGEPIVTTGGYVGVDVHKGARICAAGHGGQVLLSEQTAHLAGDFRTTDLGLHRLKDLATAERLYQLGEEDFPPLRTLYRTNLPVPSTAFLGRERELGEVLGFLSQEGVRLLTLTGPGGIGKTRLAARAAAELSENYVDGVCWVGLSSLRDPELVVPSIAAALGSGQSLAEGIGDKRMLLLLDNFEQVVEAAGDLSGLIGHCPNLDVLVTSREPLRVSGELVFEVPPLVEPDAIRLFSERASARADFAADMAVAEICRRLDNLPLAIELAAARVHELTTAAMLQRLEPRLPLLVGGPRDVPERQRTLHATIEWSYHLLTLEERHLFAKLAVFAGGYTLHAAEQVCGADLDMLGSLLDKNLVRHRDGRYWMLETIREYALERLEELGARDHITLALARYLVALPEGGAPALGIDEPVGRLVLFPASAGADRLLELLGAEPDNLRAAVQSAFAADLPDLALRLAIMMYWVAESGGGGIPFEQDQWLREGLRAAGPVSSETRADALAAAAGLAYSLGHFDRAELLAEQSLQLHREIGDDTAAMVALHILGNAAHARDDYDRARGLNEQCLELATRSSDTKGIYVSLHSLGQLALDTGDLSTAHELLGRSATLARIAGDWNNLTAIIHGQGDVALAAGDLTQATLLYREAIELDPGKLGQSVLYCIAGLAAAAAAAGRVERAGQLWGAVAALERETGWPIRDSDRRLYDDLIAIRSEAAPIRFAAAVEQGRRMTLDDALRYAQASEA